MDWLESCAVNFQNLTNFQYHFVIGRKEKSVEFYLMFEKADFHHLAGLHKLRDNDFIRTGDREKIFDRILNHQITEEKLSKSNFYQGIIGRIASLAALEQLLDGNELVFHFSQKADPATKMKADYILKCQGNSGFVFVFILQNGDNMRCISQFPMEKRDYTVNQARYTLLLKEKIDLRNNNTVLSYRNPSYHL